MTYGASGYATSQTAAQDVVPALLVDMFFLRWGGGRHAA